MPCMNFERAAGFIERELAAGTFPGASLLVARNGDQLFERHWGTYCSTTQRDNPLDAGVHHMLYSFSKGVSATAIVLAHQRRLIDYDAPVRAYVPEYCGGFKDGTTISPRAWAMASTTCCSVLPSNWASRLSSG